MIVHLLEEGNSTFLSPDEATATLTDVTTSIALFSISNWGGFYEINNDSSFSVNPSDLYELDLSTSTDAIGEDPTFVLISAQLIVPEETTTFGLLASTLLGIMLIGWSARVTQNWRSGAAAPEISEGV